MFPSKFLQFPSILTHFHAANEKIQNGGRDLAISRGLVWVKMAFECKDESDTLTPLPLVPLIYASVNPLSIGSDNGFSPVQHHWLIIN